LIGVKSADAVAVISGNSSVGAMIQKHLNADVAFGNSPYENAGVGWPIRAGLDHQFEIVEGLF
jgi:hypothetical protein